MKRSPEEEEKNLLEDEVIETAIENVLKDEEKKIKSSHP